MHKLSLGLIGGGAIALALSVVIGWLGFPHLIRSLIKKTARLERGTVTFKTWANPGASLDVYLKVHFFNVTNPAGIQNGDKPQVEEIGPYVYSEKRIKEGIERGELPETVRYRQKTYLEFQSDKSDGRSDQQDLVTFLNIPFVAIAKMAISLAAHIPDSEVILEDLDSQLMEKGETLFRTESVRNLLLDGFSVQNFLDILTDPLVEATVGEVKIPYSIKDGRFAIYKGKNGSDDGLFEVKTGQSSSEEFGLIYKWNNKTELSWWSDPLCNTIAGTDGTIFRPFIQRQHILKSYSPEVCRTLSMAYEEDIVYKNVPGFRFSPIPQIMMGPHKFEANRCFCLDKNPSVCNRNGLLLLAPCKDGAPVSLSSPHFYNADSAIISAIKGIQPVKEKHKTFIDIEPSTGVMMRAAKRLQFNFDLVPYPAIPTLAKVRRLVFPVMWAEESMELPEELAKLLIQVYHTQEKVETARWSMVGCSLICLCLGILWVVFHKEKGHDVVQSLDTKH